MKHFIVYDPVSGSVLRSGTCQDQDFQAQAREGEAVIEATRDALVIAEVNLDPVRADVCARIDAEAEAVRAKFITPGSGQVMTYLIKQTEAAAYLANPASATPFLTAEADATGTTVSALASAVAANAAAWIATGAKIEAARRKAKMEVTSAANIAALHAASQVDWIAVVD